MEERRRQGFGGKTCGTETTWMTRIILKWIFGKWGVGHGLDDLA